MLVSVKEVKPLNDYRLLLSFENGEKKIFDMKPYLDRGIYKELRNEEIFNSVSVSFDSIEWANHADIDPEFLYIKSSPYNSVPGTPTEVGVLKTS